MCGIVGYVGNNSGVEYAIEGLNALEYRGYDSAGIATFSDNGPLVVKQAGRVEALVSALSKVQLDKSHTTIGHTRWATHGSPTITNAHPHFNKSKSIYTVHNGIIENYQDLKAMLKEAGYVFISQTDTEVIPHLIDYYLQKNTSFEKAFAAALQDLRGAYAIAAIYDKQPDTVFVAKLSSPLVVGVGNDEHFIASDAAALMNKTKKVIYLDDYELATITGSTISIKNFKQKVKVERLAQELDYDTEQAKLGDFPHFMLKEIFEAPQTVQSAIRGRAKYEANSIKLGGLESVDEQLRYIDRIVIVACGTSYYAGLVGEYLIEELAGIPVEVQLASEFKYRNEPFSRSTALLAISQSGETADTIAAIKKVENFGVLKLGVVNAVGSTIARITDAGVYCHAGPEQSVASTKAFIAQVTVLVEIALHLSRGRTPLYKPLLKELEQLPDKIKSILNEAKNIESLAKKYAHYHNFVYVGRNYLFPCALEGALKLKEVTYIHAEGYAAGEMKHGPLALIDPQFPTFALALSGALEQKTISSIEEIRARKGPVLALANSDSKIIESIADDVIWIPQAAEQLQPILAAVAMQLFAYYIAIEKKVNVDRPRNLAKSVTVE